MFITAIIGFIVGCVVGQIRYFYLQILVAGFYIIFLNLYFLMSPKKDANNAT